MKLFVVFALLFGSINPSQSRSFNQIGTTAVKPDTAANLLSQAEESFFRHDLEMTKRSLVDALQANPTPEERATAEQRLATLAWRFYGEFAEAGEHLARARAIKAKLSETLIEESRMNLVAGRFEDAYRAAQNAIREAKGADVREKAIVSLAEAVVGRMLQVEVYEQGAKGFPEERSQLIAVNRLLLPIVRGQPGQFVPSKLQLIVSLGLGDGKNALMAWRSFFHVRKDIPEKSILGSADKKLANLLPRWSRNSSPKEGRSIAMALADSRLFDEAVLVTLRKQSEKSINGSAIQDIVKYARFCRRIQTITDKYYRLTAIKRGDPAAYQKVLFSEAEKLWPGLRWPGTPPPFDSGSFINEMDRRFGAEINLGTTAGYLDLHMGHRVIDEKRTVSQYGQTADIRFVSLDTLVSDGFQTWAWDGRAMHGGWATDSKIVQIRPAYNDSFETWKLLTDPVEKKRVDDEIIRDTAADQERAKHDPYAFLPGLQKRLLRRGREGLLAELKGRGLDGEDLHLTFLDEYEHDTVETSIFAHEGRHAIDSRLKLDLTVDEREYRAKLSETAFAEYPCLHIGSIFDANIGDETSHGIANLKIMKGIVRWMNDNAGVISGLDRSKPMLPQFDLLTDEQIREAFRSMDPLYVTSRA